MILHPIKRLDGLRIFDDVYIAIKDQHKMYKY